MFKEKTGYYPQAPKANSSLGRGAVSQNSSLISGPLDICRRVSRHCSIPSNHPITYQRYEEGNRHTARSIRNIPHNYRSNRSTQEASSVLVPASLNDSEKIVGNMMLSPRYRAKNAMSDKVPEKGFECGFAGWGCTIRNSRRCIDRNFSRFMSMLP